MNEKEIIKKIKDKYLRDNEEEMIKFCIFLVTIGISFFDEKSKDRVINIAKKASKSAVKKAKEGD